MNIIDVESLKKSFHGNIVLDGVSFTIREGSFTALLGKNGSGKSTILNILMGGELIDSGTFQIFGESIRSNPDHLKNDIGHISENIKFNYPLSIKEFIPFYAKFFINFDQDLFFKLGKELGLDLSKSFFNYSRGQKMQIVFMAALSQKPKLLLIDEITSVLDAKARHIIMNHLKEFHRLGGTVVLTTNIVSEVQFFCTDVLFLNDKKIKFQTTLSEIPINFKKVRSPALLTASEYLYSGTNSDHTHSYIVPAHVQGPNLLDDRRAVTLEDLYIYHSQRDVL